MREIERMIEEARQRRLWEAQTSVAWPAFASRLTHQRRPLQTADRRYRRAKNAASFIATSDEPAWNGRLPDERECSAHRAP